MSNKDLQEPGKARAKINDHALNSVIIIEDDIQLTNVLMQFGSHNILAAYCDPKDRKAFEAVSKALVKARAERPMVTSSGKDGQSSEKQRSSDVLFLLLANANMEIAEFSLNPKAGP